MHTIQKLLSQKEYEVRSYSGRGMYGQYCLATTILHSSIGEVCADLLEVAEQHELADLVSAFRSLRTDNMGNGTVVYFPGIKYIDTKCQYEYLPDEDGTVYMCGSGYRLVEVDGIYLCQSHKRS